MPGMNLSVSPAQMPEILQDMARANLVCNITSSPGSGKSQIVDQFIEKNNLHLVDKRLAQSEPVDLNGYPMLNQETKKMIFAPDEDFILKGEPIPNKKSGVCLFLDEITGASRSTAGAAYKLVLDRKVGNQPLHPKTVIIAAGNHKTDKAIVNDLGTAMKSRLVNITMTTNPEDWTNWAVKNAIDHRVVSFIKFKPTLLHNFKQSKHDESFSCPRTWAFVSNYVTSKQTLNHIDLVVMAGCIGEGAATEFKTFSNIYKRLPTIETIIDSPATFTIKDEPSVQYALSTLIAYNIEKAPSELLMALERFPVEFAVVCLREAITRNPAIYDLQPVVDWCSDHSDLLF